jgi:hypothetical protein
MRKVLCVEMWIGNVLDRCFDGVLVFRYVESVGSLVEWLRSRLVVDGIGDSGDVNFVGVGNWFVDLDGG